MILIYYMLIESEFFYPFFGLHRNVYVFCSLNYGHAVSPIYLDHVMEFHTQAQHFFQTPQNKY